MFYIFFRFDNVVLVVSLWYSATSYCYLLHYQCRDVYIIIDLIVRARSDRAFCSLLCLFCTLCVLTWAQPKLLSAHYLTIQSTFMKTANPTSQVPNWFARFWLLLLVMSFQKMSPQWEQNRSTFQVFLYNLVQSACRWRRIELNNVRSSAKQKHRAKSFPLIGNNHHNLYIAPLNEMKQIPMIREGKCICYPSMGVANTTDSLSWGRQSRHKV